MCLLTLLINKSCNWCVSWVFGNCVEWNYSTMWEDFWGGDMTDLFSDGTNGAAYNNEERIRDEAEAHT